MAIESGLYVAIDGNWGDASGMAIIDDKEWTERDYGLLDIAGDHNRCDLAEAIESWISKGRDASIADPNASDDAIFDALMEWWL